MVESTPETLAPEMATTSPFASVTRVGYQRGSCIDPVACQVVPSKMLAWVMPLRSPSASLCPPATSTRPSDRKA